MDNPDLVLFTDQSYLQGLHGKSLTLTLTLLMIIYSGLLISWIFAYESNVFLLWAGSYANFKNQSNC